MKGFFTDKGLYAHFTAAEARLVKAAIATVPCDRQLRGEAKDLNIALRKVGVFAADSLSFNGVEWHRRQEGDL